MSINEVKLDELHFYDFPVLEKTIYPISSVNRQVHGGDSPAKRKIHEAKRKMFTAHVHFTRVQTHNPEPVFLNAYGAQESIPRNEFRQPMFLAGRYNKPIPPRFLAPIDCLNIPALYPVLFAYQGCIRENNFFYRFFSTY